MTFFDTQSVTRAWIKANALVSFKAVEEGIRKIKLSALDKKLYENRLLKAKAEARKALSMSLIGRLQKYNFTARFKETGKDKKKRATPEKLGKKGKVINNKKAKKDTSVVLEKTGKKKNEPIDKKGAKKAHKEKKDISVLKDKNKSLRVADKSLDDELEMFAQEQTGNYAEMVPPKKRTRESKRTLEKQKKAKQKNSSKKFRIDAFTFENAENILTPELFSDDGSTSSLSDLVIEMF